MTQKTFKSLTVSLLAAGVVLASQGVLAHSNLVTRTVEEGNTIYNSVAITHGCGDESGEYPVIANSVVFPDGTDSTIKVEDANGEPVTAGALTDYVSGALAVRHVVTRDAFEKNAQAHGRNEEQVGVHSWKGFIPAHDSIGLVNMRITGVQVNDLSCAKTVKFEVAVADICKITNVAGFANPANVNFWTPIVGSNFDRADGENEPTSLTITRTTPMPETDEAGNACGEGLSVTVTPSAAQLNHDMPIPGVWPRKK